MEYDKSEQTTTRDYFDGDDGRGALKVPVDLTGSSKPKTIR